MARAKKTEKVGKITKDMMIADVIKAYPQTFEVFVKHGLGCLFCHGAAFETVEQGALAHGIDLEILLKELNAATSK
ncbi:MAG: DUF1858 domain-containing protein [Candidatus Micrarchaeia archaeon]